MRLSPFTVEAEQRILAAAGNDGMVMGKRRPEAK
jgi:hypothetical protein